MANIMEKYQGIIVKFNNERKFGFIELKNTNKEIFFHIRGFRVNRNPIIGEQVVFDISTDKNNRPVAINIQEARFVAKKQQERRIRQQTRRNRQERQHQKQGVLNAICLFGIVYLILLAVILSVVDLPLTLLAIYPIMGVMSFMAYLKDKTAAQFDDWRVPEKTLHLLDILGGWIGASFAHKFLNHKATKAEFRMAFYRTVILHIIGVIGFIYFI